MPHHQPTATTTTTTTVTRQCRSSCGCVGRLIKKLKKQSNKMLCMVTRPAPFDCHYDPLSYARNFDHSGCGGDDSAHFLYTFSSRFVAAAKQPLVQGNNITR